MLWFFIIIFFYAKIISEVCILFGEIKLTGDRPYYLQIKDYIKELIFSGMLQSNIKLPSTRELSHMMKVSRNTVLQALDFLEDEGFLYTVKGRGVYVSDVSVEYQNSCSINWRQKINGFAQMSEKFDIIKHEAKWGKGMISFKSIAPDDKLFDVEDIKRSFLNAISREGTGILNYGYAKGYKPLIDYLMKYMNHKGVNIEGKDILITNGFTEGFNIVLSALMVKGDKIICENPTHNTAIKIMRLHELDITGIKMKSDGIDTGELENAISQNPVKLAYIIPSYHNPTGIVMSPEKRIEVYKILQRYEIPLIEDGFNEELRFTGSHIAPIAALEGSGNNVIYTGSFSKIFCPGIRIGWILADAELISYLESIKRAENIHSSVLDQAILYEYLKGGNFEKYINKVRKIYREKYDWALKCAKEYIPCRKILGTGGLHIFIELDNINSRKLLDKCIKKDVIFTPGDIFYVDGSGQNTMRLGFSRVSFEDIEKGFRIIGDAAKEIG